MEANLYQSFINWIRENRWKVFFILFGLAIAITFTVYNAIKIDKLVSEIRSLSKKHDMMQNQNELLQAKLIKLKSPDRIIRIAKTQLGLVIPEKAPVVIEKENK